jgi:putative DNA-invertase from lambdoid prophage Rac
MVFAQPNTQRLLLIFRFAFLRVQHLLHNDARKSQQHEGEHDLDPLSIGGAKSSRPQLDRLMQDIRSSKIERLLVFKLDRLGRSLTHLAPILDELNRLKVPLIASSHGIDTSDDNPAGRLHLGVLMAMAEFERGIIKVRVNDGLAAAKARGVQLGRPATINGRADEVRGLRTQGLGLRAIARPLGMPPSSVHKALQLAA